MLRITVDESPTEQKWSLQGRLAGPWVAQLAACWSETQAGRHDRACLVDVTSLTSVDEAGEDLLRTMMSEGAQFLGCGVYTTHMLESLGRSCKRER